MAVPTDRRPIGYWLKLVDRLIDERLDATLRPLTRRHWQILNVVHQGPADQTAIDERLRPFLVNGTTAPEVDDLRRDGWITDTTPYELSESGVERFQRLLMAVSSDRARSMQGISQDQYAATIATLEQIARNLGWDGS
jgi:DNA-binding PadR family transcriptional regulator